MARQSKRISLHSLVGNYDEGPTSSTGGDGTIGDETSSDCDRNADRVRALLLAVSDHDHLNRIYRMFQDLHVHHENPVILLNGRSR